MRPCLRSRRSAANGARQFCNKEHPKLSGFRGWFTPARERRRIKRENNDRLNCSIDSSEYLVSNAIFVGERLPIGAGEHPIDHDLRKPRIIDRAGKPADLDLGKIGHHVLPCEQHLSKALARRQGRG